MSTLIAETLAVAFAMTAVVALGLAVVMGVPPLVTVPAAAVLGYALGMRQARAEDDLSIRALSEQTRALESEISALKIIREEEEGEPSSSSHPYRRGEGNT